MKFHTAIQTTYHCSLEQAFKMPMLCDVTKIHTGFGVMPKVTHCTDDENWGQVHSSKKVFAAKTWSQKGGFVSMDHVLERRENDYWKIKVDDFQSWMLGFYQFVGEWKTTEISPNTIQINYSYTMYAHGILYYPLNWLFTKLFWRKYMKQVLKNIEQLIENDEPYKYL